MESFIIIFKAHPGQFLMIFLGFGCASFVILRWRYLLKYMKPGHLLAALAVFIGNIYLGVSILSRALNAIYP